MIVIGILLRYLPSTQSSRRMIILNDYNNNEEQPNCEKKYEISNFQSIPSKLKISKNTDNQMFHQSPQFPSPSRDARLKFISTSSFIENLYLMSLYHEASQFLDNKGKFGSLKTIIYSHYENTKSRFNASQIFALVSDTLKYKTLLTDIITKAQLLKYERKLTLPIALLMVHDLLFTKSGRINCGKSAIKDAVLRHKTRLKAEMARYKVKHKITDVSSASDKSFVNDETPVRWFRTNTILSTDEEVQQAFNKLNKVDSWQQLANDKNAIFYDIYVPYLYGINPSYPLTSLDIYKQGKITIQDRASCFPATILNPKPGDKIIDTCAAPGNKTAHLATFVDNKPNSITAFERDTKRSQVLKMMIDKAGASKCVQIENKDFLTTDPQDYPNVTSFIVDPSCSGSGIFGRAFDEESNHTDSQDKLFRLHRLAEFQYKIVSHAMSFPNAKTVVYSTCSIHAQENEHVVRRLLEDTAIQERGWSLRPRNDVLPEWPRRGLVEEFPDMINAESLASSCVRALPSIDGGIGFFAVCFERNADFSVESDDSEYSSWDGF